jgi:hypothetical protein
MDATVAVCEYGGVTSDKAAHGKPASSDCAGKLVAWVRGLADCVLEPGLSDTEISEAQVEFGVAFPSAWKEVLKAVHPVSIPRDPDGIRNWVPYPDWRGREADATHQLVERPIEGILFDVEHNGFWWRAWGPNPKELDERLNVAARQLAAVPRLAPIRSHWYVGVQDGSPVLSIVQTDIWSPATTLCDLPNGRDESGVPLEDYPLGKVPFWSELHAWSQIGHMSRFGDRWETRSG